MYQRIGIAILFALLTIGDVSAGDLTKTPLVLPIKNHVDQDSRAVPRRDQTMTRRVETTVPDVRREN